MADKIEAIENDFILKKRGTNELVKVKRRNGTGIQYVLIILILIMGVGLSSAILSPEQKNEPNAPITGEFRVNTYQTENQTFPKVARADSGQSVVTWISEKQEGALNGWGIYAQVIDNGGVKIGPELHVNTDPMYNQGTLGALDVGMCNPIMGNLTFIVVWGDEEPTPNNYDVLAQVYNVSMLPPNIEAIGSNFVANWYTQGSQGGMKEMLSISMDAGCNRGAITWGTFGETGSSPHDDFMGDIFAREFRFNAQGLFAFDDIAEWRVNTNLTTPQYDPEISINDNGAYVICWASYHTANPQEIMARRFTWTAGQGSTPIDGQDFNASDLTSPTSDYEPTCSIMNNGYFMIGWTHNTNVPATGLDAYGIAYDNNRQAPYPPMCMTLFSGTCLGNQYAASASTNRSDTWVWTWTDNGMDGSYEGVYGWMGTWTTIKGDVFRVTQTTLGNQSVSDVAMSSDGSYIIAWASEQSPKDAYGRIYNNVPNVPELGTGWFTACILATATSMASIVIGRSRPRRGQ